MAALMRCVSCGRKLLAKGITFRPTELSIQLNKLHVSTVRLESSGTSEKEEPKELEFLNYAAEELDEVTVDEIRNVSRLSAHLYCRFKGEEMSDLDNNYKRSLKYRRKMYAKHGSASGLDPVLMWPNKEDLQEIVEITKNYEPSLSELIASAKQKEDLMKNKEKAREQAIHEAMDKMPQHIAAYAAKRGAVQQEVLKAQAKREQMIEEARDILGYDVDPKDPRLKAMLEEREETAAREAKAAKKASKQAKTTARILQQAGEGS